ncbi:MAG: hypothetical protein HN350_04780 [Phycisphaerales bacterium]|jgi:hypothetical protein|nr:hypothetical protein [Phycisphaerales bacterium]
MKHAKTIIAVISAAALSVCIGLIPSCKQKENETVEKQRSENEIILTLQRSAGTTTVPDGEPWVTIDSHLDQSKTPLAQRDDIAIAIYNIWMKHKDKTVVVIRANPEDLTQSVTKLIRIVVCGQTRTLRLEAGDIQAPLDFPHAGGRDAIELPWNRLGRKGAMHITTLYILDGDQTGGFAIGNKKFKSYDALAEALVAIKKHATEDPPGVSIAYEPKAIWRNVVLACKAAADAEIKNRGMFRIPKEHQYMPEADLPLPTRQRRQRKIRTRPSGN